jgi:hypothetical protein
MADDRPQENSGDSSDGSGLSANLDRPKRAGPTLDLDAAEISDQARNADENAERVEPKRRPMVGIVSAAIVSAIFGGSAAALVIAAAWWTGWLAHKAPPAPQPAPVNTAVTDALAARIAKVETSVKTPSAPVPDPAVAARLDTNEKSLQSIRAELAAAHAQSEQLVSSVNEFKSAPHETPPPAPTPPPTDLSPINNRIAQLENTTKAIAADVAKHNATPPPASDMPLRRVVAAALLDMSVRQGEPYAAALAAAKPIAPNADVLKPLEPFAASGVPSANAMGAELQTMAAKLSPRVQEHSVTGSIVDRLEAGAARLVRIQRTDVPIGSDRNAIMARATAAAQRNDIVEARRELNTLSPPDRASVQPWIDKADARDAALLASRQFAADMMAALSKPGP